MFFFLLILFTLIPALEFYILYTIGSQIGAFNTFLIIILTGFFGAFLAKLQGLSVLIDIQKTLARGQIPTKEILHGFVVFGGGLLLLTPGFLTDIFGFLMIISGTRHLIVTFLMLYFKRAIARGSVSFFTNIKMTRTHHHTSEFSSDFSFKPKDSDNQDNIIEADYKKLDAQDE